MAKTVPKSERDSSRKTFPKETGKVNSVTITVLPTAKMFVSALILFHKFFFLYIHTSLMTFLIFSGKKPFPIIPKNKFCEKHWSV